MATAAAGGAGPEPLATRRKRRAPSLVSLSWVIRTGGVPPRTRRCRTSTAFSGEAMLNTIDIDLTGRRVLDAGCNRGGFLRLLVDEFRIAEGYGYDPASEAIDDARRLIGQRPLTFETGDTVPDGWAEFDAAFSHEVLYVLHDLAAHAVATFSALETRGAVLRGDGGPRREPDDVGVARARSRASLRYPGCMTSTRWSRSLTMSASRCPSPGSGCSSFPSLKDGADMSIGTV